MVEFNARFGDPETQVVLDRLATPLGGLLPRGGDRRPGRRRPGPVAAGRRGDGGDRRRGLPGQPDSGDEIDGLADAAAQAGAYVLHAGTTTRADGTLVSSGGRVLNVVGAGDGRGRGPAARPTRRPPDPDARRLVPQRHRRSGVVTAAEPGPDGPRGPDGPDAAGAGPDSTDGSPGPLRVSTLELFFDLVFAFTLTQLTAVLADGLNAVAVVQVLLVFGLLWWMYEGYAWLTNTRPPVHATERLLLLVGMAGFLVVGLAIPHGFGGDGVMLGLGYLLVVLVHAVPVLPGQRQHHPDRAVQHRSALLITWRACAGGPARYPLWVAALVIQLGSPLIVHPRNLFELRPDHMAERHSALLIVALGESVAAIGIGAAVLGGTGGRLVLSAVLGLALAAALWWIIFGGGDEERTARALTAAPPRPAHRAGPERAVLRQRPGPARPGRHGGGRAGGNCGLGAPHGRAPAGGGGAGRRGGALPGRRRGRPAAARHGRTALRLAGAAAALVTTAVGAVAGLDAQLALVAVLAAMLAAERRRDSGTAG